MESPLSSVTKLMLSTIPKITLHSEPCFGFLLEKREIKDKNMTTSTVKKKFIASKLLAHTRSWNGMDSLKEKTNQKIKADVRRARPL